MSRDSSFTYVHFRAGRYADIFEDFCRDKLPDDDIYVAPQHQPINPEDEDDVIPDQHAAFGIAQAQQKKREPAWKDLGLQDLLDNYLQAALFGPATSAPPNNLSPRKMPR